MNEASVAKAQVAIAVFYACAFVAVLVLLIVKPPVVDEFGKATLQTLFGGLLVIVTQQSGYFFARQRPDVTAPNTQTIVTNRTVEVPPIVPKETPNAS